MHKIDSIVVLNRESDLAEGKGFAALATCTCNAHDEALHLLGVHPRESGFRFDKAWEVNGDSTSPCWCAFEAQVKVGTLPDPIKVF